jgi:DNA-binding IclR family transcriptional regulator
VIAKRIVVLISNGHADVIKCQDTMQFVGQRPKELLGIAVYTDFLRYASEGFLAGFRQRNGKDFRIVAHGLCTGGVITDSIPWDARPGAIGATKGRAAEACDADAVFRCPLSRLTIFLLDKPKQFHNMRRVPQSKTSDSPYKVQVLDRALAALAILAKSSSDCSLAELCPALKLHKSTVHRLMMVLEQHRLVVKNPDTGRYRLGLRLFELGSRAIDGLDLRGRARPYLDRLQDEFGETVFFCILDEGQVFYVEKVESQRSVRTACTVGSRAPAYCTAVGKAMLAELPDVEVSKIVRRWGLKAVTPNTITTAGELKAELQAVRARGFAIDDEEKEEGLRCIGAAVRSHSGKLAAAMSISGPAFRMTKERVPEIGRALMEAASKLSAELGYQAAPAELLSSAAN